MRIHLEHKESFIQKCRLIILDLFQSKQIHLVILFDLNLMYWGNLKLNKRARHGMSIK